jgi:hypothetical protein
MSAMGGKPTFGNLSLELLSFRSAGDEFCQLVSHKGASKNASTRNPE